MVELGKKEKDIIFIFVRLNSTYWDSFPKQRKSRIHCLLDAVNKIQSRDCKIYFAKKKIH